jgi:hypothetical protein
MSGNSDRPFDHDTLKLRAVFVPDETEGEVSRDDIVSALGHDTVKIPAIFVPEGGTPPGYPYERFGQAEFRPDQDAGEENGDGQDDGGQDGGGQDGNEQGGAGQYGDEEYGAAQGSSWPWTVRPPGGAQRNRRAGPAAPLTEDSSAAARADSGPSRMPPNPAVTGGKGDPIAAGIAVWRGLANPADALRRSLAASAPTYREQGDVIAAAATGTADGASPVASTEALEASVPQPMPPPGEAAPSPGSDAAQGRVIPTDANSEISAIDRIRGDSGQPQA